jgi:hypothetical protein
MQSQDSSLRYAFLNQYNLILLAGAAGLSLALESPVPIMVGALGELLWLLISSASPSFQRWAAEQASLRRREQVASEAAVATRGLDPAYAARIQTAAEMADDIRRFAAERQLDPSLFGPGGERLQESLATLTKMATVHHRLSHFMAGTQASQIEDEVVRLGKLLAAEKDPGVRLSLKQALTVAQRRLKQHEQIESTRRALEAKMKTLELSLDYLRSQVVAGASEFVLGGQLAELGAGATFITEVEAETNAALATPRREVPA